MVTTDASMVRWPVAPDFSLVAAAVWTNASCLFVETLNIYQSICHHLNLYTNPQEKLAHRPWDIRGCVIVDGLYFWVAVSTTIPNSFLTAQDYAGLDGALLVEFCHLGMRITVSLDSLIGKMVGPLWDSTLAVEPPKEPFKRGYAR